MKVLRTIVFSAIVVSVLTSCADDPAEDFLWANWLATSVKWHDCDDISKDGNVNCNNTIDNCVSCIKLNLLQSGNYTLTNTLNGQANNEIGTYKTKSGAIELNPASGSPYDLPITDSTPTILVVEFPGDGNCIATIKLTATSCN